MSSKRPKITGEIVKDWTEFGHHFQVKELLTPIQRGAGMRTHRLWDNGYPASGGQWHYDLAGALRRADYVLQDGYSNRIAWLEMRVAELEHELRQVVAHIPATVSRTVTLTTHGEN